MKIFLENRIIKLSRKPPKVDSANDIVFEYSYLSKLYEAFEVFEKQENLRRIIFWSADYFPKLKDDFLSLFKYIKAAGGLVKNERNEVLVIFKYGKWDLPKGKIASIKSQPGSPELKANKTFELPADAAIREVMEETGLKQVSIIGKLPSTYHIYYQKDTRYLKKTFWFGMIATSDQPLIPQSDEDISIVKWASHDELPSIAENSYSSLKKLFQASIKS